MYYLISFVYNQDILYCIWVSNDEDYVMIKENKIMVFRDIECVKEYVRRNNIIIKMDEETQYNLDKLIKWCGEKNNVIFDYGEVLNFWNICVDVANSIKVEFAGNDHIYDDIYEKIFCADSLSCVNNDVFFSDEDIIHIKKVLKEGIKIITRNFADEDRGSKGAQ